MRTNMMGLVQNILEVIPVSTYKIGGGESQLQ